MRKFKIMAISVDHILKYKFKQFINCFAKKVIQESENNQSLKFVCLIDDCRSEYSDKSGAIRHLRKHHKEIQNAIVQNKFNAEQSEHDKIEKQIEIRVKVDPEAIWNACVDLVTINSLPLNFVEYDAFKKVLNPYVTSLKLRGIDLTINRINIKDRIAIKAAEIKKIISDEIKLKIVSLMIDIASRHNRSVLGINVSYMFNDEIRIRTIGMQVLHCTHTSLNLVAMIREKLAEFGMMNLQQIISITTDNGKNMLKSTALLDAEYQNEKDSAMEAELIAENGDDDENNDDEDIDNETFDLDYYSDLLTNVRSAFSNDVSYTDLIHGISCAAHCLQLVIIKAIKNCLETQQLIEKCRELCKKLRTPTYRSMLKSNKLKQAKMDVNTRWNSIYTMVSLLIIKFHSLFRSSPNFNLFFQLQRLVELKAFCESRKDDNDIKTCLLNEVEWLQIEQVMNILGPFYKYTMKLQSEVCTLSDFFGFWSSLCLKMQKFQHELSNEISQEMKLKEEMLLHNPVITAAIYLDPRYQRALKTHQKELAIDFLKTVYHKIQTVESQHEENISIASNQSDRSSSSVDELTSYLDSINESVPSNQEPASSLIDANIEPVIRKFNGRKEPLNTSIFDFWKKNSSIEPELYKLSCVLFAIPPTQTSVERAFSSLALVLTPHRTLLSDDTLENILLIRTNRN